MTVLSIDLAYKRCADLGIVALSQAEDGLFCDFVSPPDFSDCPKPERVAMWVLEVAHRQGANYIILDGPQAWKDPDNGFFHSRVCERELKKAKHGDLVDRLERLGDIYSLELSMQSPSHDQLQALVSGLGAANYAFGARRRTTVASVAPRYVEGIPREGYILNPSREPLPT